MLLARTDAAAISNAPAGLFGGAVLCGVASDPGHRRMSCNPSQTDPKPQMRPTEPAVAPEPAKAPLAACAAAGLSARLWASYAMGRA